MEIVKISLQDNDQFSLAYAIDRPWLVLKALEGALNIVKDQMAAKEAKESGVKVQEANGDLARKLLNRG